MKQLLKDHWKRYVISSVLSFLSGFAIAVIPDIGNLGIESLRDGSLVGLLFLGVRAGVKGLLEVFLGWYSLRKQ